jgi:hypothetical protein
MNIAMPPGDLESLRPMLAALHLLALALLVPVVLAWARHGRRRLLVASAFSTVLAIMLIYLKAIRASDIPVDWITIVQEGLERKSIFHLYTRGVHAGANFAFVVSAAAAGTAPTLHDVVWLNLLLALVNAAIFLHVAAYITGSVWALPWTLVFALNPATFQASFSELPTNLLALYFLAAVIAWAVLNDPLPQPAAIRKMAYGLGAVLTVLVGLTRFEVGLIGAVALALHAAHALLGADWWSAAGRRLRAAGERPLVFFADHPAAVAVLCVVGWGLSRAGLPGLVSRTEVASIYPFNPAVFSLFAFLPMLLLPTGVTVATLFGFIHALAHFRRFGGLAVSLLMLVLADFAAENEYHEMARYLSYILPAIFFLGLFGKAELDRMARRWRPHWRRAARIGYVMAWFTLPLPGTLQFFARPEYHVDGGFSQLLLDLNTQREVRHLVALTENNPQCVFVGRVVEDEYGDPMVATQYAYVVFGAPVAQPFLVPEKEVQLEDVIARYASGASCVRLYYGGDCNLTFADGCKQFIAGRRLVDEQRLWSRPYNNPLEMGYGAPEIVLATYAWP